MYEKTIIISVSFILLLCGCINNENVNLVDNGTIEKEIKENLNKISEISDLKSSNPYDYIKNEYYDNIVNLGDDAVSILEYMYSNGELMGVDAYISALAIQDITKCNLYEKYDLDWQKAEEFYELWKNNNCGFKK